ncbi:meiosis-specific with OB domain-containing protein isoform X4 [Bemisia tabaci]|uniref:meiosis-specific with OB domain-containing protein isoform X4 n=1 Tax=Bemisia tabaci TaxID=7038 RepID=UPI003B27B421
MASLIDSREFTKRVAIKDLNPSVTNILIIGIVIDKRSPRIVSCKKRNTEKSLLKFTMRDSEVDFINVTMWGSQDFIENLSMEFYMGTVVTDSSVITAEGFRYLGQHGLLITQNVGEVKRIKMKEGEEKEMREISVMDRTFNSMPLTIWELEMVIRAGSWKPCRTTLFLADFKLEWNKYKSKYALSYGYRSIIIDNPITEQAQELATWAYSTALASKDENIPFPIDPKTVNTVMSSRAVREKVKKEGTRTFTALVYAVIYHFDLDGCSAPTVVRQCEYCNWSVNEDDTCKNCNCPSGAGTELPSTVTVFDIRMHIADHTGNLMNCKLTQAVAKHLCQCSAEEFLAKTDDEKTALKFRTLFKHHAVRIIVSPNSCDNNKPKVTALSCERTSLSTHCTLVPMM